MSRDLLCLCLLCAAVRVGWMLLVPTGEAPDEYTHTWVINFLAGHLRLPGAAEVAAAGPDAVYGSLPPMGYLPHVLLRLCLPQPSHLLSERFGSLLMGLVAVWLSYRIARELFAGDRLLTLALPLMLVFHPQLVFVHSYANNDVTASALAGGLVYLMVITLKRGPDLRRSLLAGLLVGWLALSKYSGWTIIPVVFASFAAGAFLHGIAPAAAAGCLFSIALPALALSGWWFVRNYYQYHGDFLGTRTMYHTWAVAFHRQLSYRLPAWQIVCDKRWWRFLLFSFWGVFGYVNRYLYRPLYYLFLCFQLGSLAGWLGAGWRAARHGEPARSSRAGLVEPAVWIMLALCVTFNLAGMVYASTVNLGGPQGRYLIVSEIPAMAILIAGLAALGPRVGRWAVIILLAFTAAVCAGAWIMLWRLYGFPARL